MSFYEILQKDPAVIKGLIRNTDDKKEIKRLKFGMGLRSLLIVLFAIAFIAPLTSVFGSENSCMAVSIFCILLGVRFVDFGYCIQDSILNLTIVFLLLLISPVLAYYVNPVLGFIIHFLSFFAILLITCDRPEMGNGGLFNFAYIFLSGNPVAGKVFWNRFLLMCVGLTICGIIFFVKHRHKHQDIKFKDKLAEFSLYNQKHQWQIRMSLGIALILILGSFFGLERFMWAGFACGSLLSDHSENPEINERFLQRVAGVFAGSIAFYIIYSIIPSNLHIVIGPLGGFLLGFCTDYKYKTAMNCFGALMLASGIYGVQSAILLRIFDTFVGIIFAVSFFNAYEFLVNNKYREKFNHHHFNCINNEID
ncbi:FUSC family protein [Peptacetobacter sp.]|uniref:FUSC family protein n=1 Tax=Peptacetobacter sp. TaxID=2991975 RepID=UPI00261D5851|nr:FUSC family protein [Peptacetobacter sp.]